MQYIDATCYYIMSWPSNRLLYVRNLMYNNMLMGLHTNIHTYIIARTHTDAQRYRRDDRQRTKYKTYIQRDIHTYKHPIKPDIQTNNIHTEGQTYRLGIHT